MCKIILLFLLLPVMVLSQGIRVNEPFPISAQTPALQAAIRAHAGKPMILDIFGSTCSTCFTQMPKLQELQNLMGNSLQIILVGHADSKIRQIYNRVAGNYGIILPVVYDSLLYPQTSSRGFPTCIWIDAQGITRSINSSIDITRKSLQSFALGKSAPMTRVQRDDMDADTFTEAATKPLFFLQRSLTKWQPGQPTGNFPNTTPLPDTVTFYSTKLSNLFCFASTGKKYWSPEEPEYLEFYSLPLIDSMGTLIKFPFEERYRYSLIIRGRTVSDSVKLAYLREDLEQTFNYKLRIETRKVPYWRLTAMVSDTLRLRTAAAKKMNFHDAGGYNAQNIKIADLINGLHYYHPQGPIFVDETNIQGGIDLTIEAAMSDLTAVQAALAAKGISLKEGQREMKVMVLYSQKNSAAGK